MKKIISWPFWMLATILLISCNPNAGLAKLWFFTNGGDASLTPVNFLQLRPDGIYTRDFGKFESGKWTNENQQLNLMHDGKTETLNIKLSGNEMQLTMPNNAVAYFESQPIPAGANPFSAENNQWRIPATAKEPDEAIRLRLLNHCKFWESYFTWAMEGKYPSVDVRSTPTLIKIYGNGFGIKPYSELPPKWVSYFYDAADCRKANEQLEYIFAHHDIAWGQTQNKYKMFIGAFQQLQQFLK